MKKAGILIQGLVLFVLAGCAEMQQVVKSVYNDQAPLSQSEVIAGLKQVLSVGVDSSVARLAVADGYLKDQAVKIFLPPEAEVITRNLSKLPGGQQLVDRVVTSINRAASDAAKEASPIIMNSIRNMSIQDAFGILKGSDHAATDYLKRTSYDALVDLYRPKIQGSLNEKLVGNLSAQQSWNDLTGKWNTVAKSAIGQMASLETVETDLSAYLTRKALDGLFLKIAATERDIREDPAARVTDLLKRVFSKQ